MGIFRSHPFSSHTGSIQYHEDPEAQGHGCLSFQAKLNPHWLPITTTWQMELCGQDF